MARVNQKFGKGNTPEDTVLQKTTNLLDEAELLLAAGISPDDKDKSESNLLSDVQPDDSAFNDASGQRELDSDEMEEEMMDEYTPN